MTGFDLVHLQQIRLFEIEQFRTYFTPGQTVLEIGAGAGWQARYLSDLGLRVIAVDVSSTNYDFHGTWNVVLYDGFQLPLADHSIDFIFSSNVLEHIPHVESFQRELLRVLKPDGFALHLMPSSSWRFWTSVTKYVDTTRRVLNKIANRSAKTDAPDAPLPDNPVPHPVLTTRLADLLIPETHGEVGNSLTELYYFSRHRWSRLLQNTGWTIEDIQSNHLFYTGYSAFGSRLSMKHRQSLARILGGACWAYIVRPDQPTDAPSA